MADGGRAPVSATDVADGLLGLTSKILATRDREMADFEDAQASKRVALSQLVERDRAAVTRATEQLNDLYRAARAIADNKGRREVLEGVLRQTVKADPTRTFDQVVEQLEDEMKLARGITGAMRIPDVGALLNQAAVQVDHLEDRANALEANLTADPDDAADAPSPVDPEHTVERLVNDLTTFDDALPFSARAWTAPAWNDWTPPHASSTLLRFGEFRDDRLEGAGIAAIIDVATSAGLLIEPGRDHGAAVAAAQSFVLRAMASSRPGSARFVLIDPTGLGASVAPFLGLTASGDEPIARLLTHEREIEDVLNSLVDDGPVIGEHTFVVVFDHPTGLSVRALTTLRALTEVSAHHGVTTLVVKDPRPGRQPAEARALPALRALRTGKKGFVTATPHGNWMVALDTLPADHVVERIVAGVTEHAAAAGAHEDVGDESTWWTGESDERLCITIGRRGRTEPLTIDLDDRTATVVASAQPGGDLSGLLRAFVTDVAISHRPTDVQLSLISVTPHRTFEVFGARRLPHARLVASDADRELAIAALESAAAEITRRTVLFQAAGTQRDGYRQYREETGNPLPRLVVVIDSAEILLGPDGLTRRERDVLARFALDGALTGVHVVLALRDEGAAERLVIALADDGLTRIAIRDDPVTMTVTTRGEATTGELTAPDDQDLGRVLRAVRGRADADRFGRSPQVVDGREVARVETAPLDLLRSRHADADGAASARLWLGEPAALGAPVELALTRRDGANVAIIHADPEIAQGLFASALLTAAAAGPPELVLDVVDFMPIEDGFGEAVVPLGRVITTHVSRRREAAERLEALRNLVVNRLARHRDTASPVIFAVNGLHVADHTQLGHLDQILHEGPRVGVHVMVWGTSAATVGDRVLRRCGMRVVGPVDAATSATLIDSSSAAHLRDHQVLLYDEFESRLVRLRPYALADAAWLATTTAAWAAQRPHAEITLA